MIQSKEVRVCDVLECPRENVTLQVKINYPNLLPIYYDVCEGHFDLIRNGGANPMMKPGSGYNANQGSVKYGNTTKAAAC